MDELAAAALGDPGDNVDPLALGIDEVVIAVGIVASVVFTTIGVDVRDDGLVLGSVVEEELDSLEVVGVVVGMLGVVAGPPVKDVVWFVGLGDGFPVSVLFVKVGPTVAIVAVLVGASV